MYPKEAEKLFLKVQKPGRYVGGEQNSVIKRREEVETRFAFCFPDTYEIGMSHLGLKILYGAINEKPYFWCERVFAPWIDMEELMRREQIPLYALESGDQLKDFDFIGFTLQYELSYTNILNMLELAGIPLLSSDRPELMNIVIGGGPCACNPEPLACFFDLFCLGDGEEIDVEVMKLYRKFKRENRSKDEFLRAAAKIDGVYVPSLYEAEYNPDGTVKAYTPRDGAPERITRRVISDLDSMYFPKSFVVPMIDIVHNRTTVEVLRGCIRGCRFCQAGYIYRPFREKSIETIDRQCREICESTGYDEISLSSLSTSDYSKLNELIDTLHLWTEKDKVNISLPSLRVDGFSADLMNRINSVRKSGLTFAPEAGSQRLRDAINKNVTERELIDTVSIAFCEGWSRIKLYFMIGLPTETQEDIESIARLGEAVISAFYESERKPGRKAVEVTLSAAAFVPKPFTPFQWFPQDSIEELRKKQSLLKSLSRKHLNINYHGAETSFLEAVFARGDRRLSAVLIKAREKGLRFDGWEACFDFEAWMKCFEEAGIDPHFYANRQRSFDEVFPWDHIDCGVEKSFLVDECRRAYSAETTPNCREQCSGCGCTAYGGGICVEKRENMVL